jgi:hypothetical protein
MHCYGILQQWKFILDAAWKIEQTNELEAKNIFHAWYCERNLWIALASIYSSGLEIFKVYYLFSVFV